jgi:hypothetical protein
MKNKCETQYSRKKTVTTIATLSGGMAWYGIMFYIIIFSVLSIISNNAHQGMISSSSDIYRYTFVTYKTEIYAQLVEHWHGHG